MLQLFMKKVVSVVLNTRSDVRYIPVSPKRMQVRSASTRIAEIADADTPQQREQPVGRDSGFLWRFNNYCALEERAEGTVVQCESISLSRDVMKMAGGTTARANLGQAQLTRFGTNETHPAKNIARIEPMRLTCRRRRTYGRCSRM